VTVPPLRTLNELFFGAADRFGRRPAALRSKQNGRWVAMSPAELVDRVRAASLGFLELGLAPGDRIALLSENRPEWAITDFACLTARCVDVAVYPTLPAKQVDYILRDSGAAAVCVSTRVQLDKIQGIRRTLPALRHVIGFDAGALSPLLEKWGYNVVLGHAHQSADEAVALWGILEARHCDAILFLGDLRDRPRLIEDLQNTSIPVVALWHGSRESGIPTVGVDNRAGMSRVVDHLVGLGHQRIAFAGPKRLGDITEREEAYLASLERHGLPRRAEYVHDAANVFGGGVAALDHLMDLDEPPTAIVAPTDVLAIGMLHAAQRRGLQVPRDVSISGFDDIPASSF